MSQLLPTIIVSLILAGVVALAVRSLWQSQDVYKRQLQIRMSIEYHQ